MGALSTGGGSGAVAASAHAGCARFRHTDALITGRSRRNLAEYLGHPDTSAGIPEARWMRAMTFERLVRHDRFVSQLIATTVGALGLARPAGVRRLDARVSTGHTATALAQAHLKAVHEGHATLITSLALPYVGLEENSATPVKPDFAIVAAREERGRHVGSWLIMGDAKDYERVRSRIDDPRMLKGFLQVALGAESAASWSQLPPGMVVHRWGALAVPRNAFLQPEAVVECLDDHRAEVRARAEERHALAAAVVTPVPEAELPAFVTHVEAEFDPARCTTCSLFSYCREELRASSTADALLVEIGVRPDLRHPIAAMLAGVGDGAAVPRSVLAAVDATLTGLAQWTGQGRIDPAGLPGTINVVLAKSDSAALGVHGVGLQHVPANGTPTPWHYHVFGEPQAPATRLAIMGLIGERIDALRREAVPARGGFTAIHIVLPDAATGDVLVSVADSLAGIETSRLRWQRDLDAGRPALTFDGEPARIPPPLTPAQRLAVSFLLEEDRARSVTLRSPLIDLRTVLGRHVVAGGPASDSGRLDHLLTWARATAPVDHRKITDTIAALAETPGARLSNVRSDELHRLRTGDSQAYRALVEEELTYKAGVVSSTIETLAALPVSKLRDAYEALEASAQHVWRIRERLHASDLVRFGRTSYFWRNSQVELRDTDAVCATQLLALGNPHVAHDLAVSAGTREVALATVVAVDPPRVVVESRRLGDGTAVVALFQNGEALIERPSVGMAVQAGSFKFKNLSIGCLEADEVTGRDRSLRWTCRVPLAAAIGDELVVADASWFKTFVSGHEIAVERPKVDAVSSPRTTCGPDDYARDPDGHRWCCRSHETAEAEWADELAARRARGELNPEVWPPIVDPDGFDTPAAGSPTADSERADPTEPPDDLTLDDLD